MIPVVLSWFPQPGEAKVMTITNSTLKCDTDKIETKPHCEVFSCVGFNWIKRIIYHIWHPWYHAMFPTFLEVTLLKSFYLVNWHIWQNYHKCQNFKLYLFYWFHNFLDTVVKSLPLHEYESRNQTTCDSSDYQTGSSWRQENTMT